MWTPATLGCNIAGTRAVPAPGTLESQVRRSSLVMTLNKCSRPAICALVWLGIALATVSPASASWKEKVLYSFQGIPDGSLPIGAVVFDPQGNLYGATQDGGSDSCRSANQCGTVFQLVPPAKKGDPWTETVLYVFKGNASNDGTTPFGGLVIDSAGNLYGTTGYGGTGGCILLGSKLGCGTVFELSPPPTQGGAWTETILYSFKGGKDGYLPNGDLAFDGAGNLYGATAFGGGHGTACGDAFYQYCGTVFELSPPSAKGGQWTEKVLHGFRGGKDGANPNGGLVLDSAGAVYGTTRIGGDLEGECSPNGCGAVFKLTPPVAKGGTWTEGVLHRFDGQDGATPDAGVIFGGNGDLYGTAYAGATSGNGAVFSLAAPKGGSGPWKETVLCRFSDGNDGANPEGALIFDASGNLYGTTYVGSGGSLQGSVFRLKPPSKKWSRWTFSVIHGFLGPPDGDFPAASLVDEEGDLYSTTQSGGTGSGCGYGGCGTVFEVKP